MVPFNATTIRIMSTCSFSQENMTISLTDPFSPRRHRYFLHAGNNSERANAAQAPAPLGANLRPTTGVARRLNRGSRGPLTWLLYCSSKRSQAVMTIPLTECLVPPAINCDAPCRRLILPTVDGPH
jgi:hypothetical protein